MSGWLAGTARFAPSTSVGDQCSNLPCVPLANLWSTAKLEVSITLIWCGQARPARQAPHGKTVNRTVARATRGGGSATPVEQLLRLERSMEVASEMQQPAVLRSDLGADEAHALVRVPVLSACATSPHLGFELHSMVMRSRHAARDAAIPSVPVPLQSQAVSLEASGIALFVLLIIGQLHNADDDYGCCDLERHNKRASR